MFFWKILLIFGLVIGTSSGKENIRRQDVDVDGAPEAPFIVTLLNNTLSYVLPMFDKNESSRAEEISNNLVGYLYGPSLLGNLSYYPTGTLGKALVQEDVEYYFLDITVQAASVKNDSTKVLEAIEVSRDKLNGA